MSGRRKEISKMTYAFGLAFLLMISALLIVDVDDDISVEASMSSTTDDQGYVWIDSKGNDPKIEYDYKDVHTTGSKVAFTNGYVRYGNRKYADTVVQLPFDFYYYGEKKTSVDICTAGMIGFDKAKSSSSYFPGGFRYYYNDFTIASSRSPDDTVYVYAGYYYYMNMPDNWGGAGVFTQAGTDSDGTEYFVIQWYRAMVCYYRYQRTSYTMDFEVILYEDGRILCQYKDVHTSYSSSYSYGDSALLGIESPDGSTGLQYCRDQRYGIRNGEAILYKQFKTEFGDTEFRPGYGEEEDIYPAQAGVGVHDYWARTTVYSERGLDYLEELDLTIGANTDEEQIILRYDFLNDEFNKYNDPSRKVVLLADRSDKYENATDPDHLITIEFRFDFKFNWDRLTPVSLKLQIRGNGVMTTTEHFEDVFKVETFLEMVGNVTVENGRGQVLGEDGFVLGGDTLHFYGPTREYKNKQIPIAPPDMFKIGVMDKAEEIYVGTSGPNLDTYSYIDPQLSEVEYELVFINTTPFIDRTSDALEKWKFKAKVDSLAPGMVPNVQVIPDSSEGLPQDYDNDRDVYLVWDVATDVTPGSGVAYYHISVNKDKGEASPSEIKSYTNSTTEALLQGLDEGLNLIYIWAEDSVGNVGRSVWVEVTIDLTQVTFAGFYPSTQKWINNVRPTCSILINDTDTGVDPETIEYEISTQGEVNLGGEDNWQSIAGDTYAPGKSLRVVVSGWFKPGKDNWIRFRAQDLAGNEEKMSDAYNVWIDTESPTYKSLFSETEYQLDQTQEVGVQIQDIHSGVDLTSIEYRFTTQGTTKWTPWYPYLDAVSVSKPTVYIRQTFRRGDDNYVQVRARDLAGNPASTSQAYNIKINTYPEVVISSPDPGAIYYDNEDIIFDASQSYDPDTERLSFQWFNGPESKPEESLFGDSAQKTTQFGPGEYTITLVVKDRVNNVVKKTFVITVEEYIPPEPPREADSDGDGMPDWYETKYKLEVEFRDAQEDPDGDGFKNIVEFWNLTNPKDDRSHPTVYDVAEKEEAKGPFDGEMWALWAVLAVLIIAVIITMIVAKTKKDRAVKRIKTVRNMRKIMPSVSWDQITTTAYIAPMTQGAALPAAAGPALPTASPQQVDQSSALPPAQQPEGGGAHEATHVPQQAEGVGQQQQDQAQQQYDQGQYQQGYDQTQQPQQQYDQGQYQQGYDQTQQPQQQYDQGQYQQGYDQTQQPQQQPQQQYDQTQQQY